MPNIEISPGDLIDRLTVLEIKSERISDQTKRKSVNIQLSKLLVRVAESFGADHQSRVWPLYERLKACNAAIWDAEEEIRKVDWADDSAIAHQSRIAHSNNDARFRLKREIDVMMNWAAPEEKSYL